MRQLLLAAAALAAVLVLAMTTLDDDSNYYAERTAQVQAQQAAQTERTALAEANHTERTAINAALLQWQMAQEAQTMRLMLMLVFAFGVLAVSMVTVVIVIVLRRQAQAQETTTLLRDTSNLPQPSAAILQMWRWYPAHTLEYNEDAQQWSLVAADGRYMLESEIVTASPRRITQR